MAVKESRACVLFCRVLVLVIQSSDTQVKYKESHFQCQINVKSSSSISNFYSQNVHFVINFFLLFGKLTQILTINQIKVNFAANSEKFNIFAGTAIKFRKFFQTLKFFHTSKYRNFIIFCYFVHCYYY